MSTEYKKPLPATQPWSEEFWKAAKLHKLVIQTCKKCNTKIFYPRKFCPNCWSSDLGWSEATGKARVYTFTITMDMVEEKFKEDLPYALAIVELEEGIRMMTRIVDCKPEDVYIGMDVQVVFEDITDDYTLPFFKPATNG